MKKKLVWMSDDSKIKEKKMKSTTEEKSEQEKTEGSQKIILPGPPYFTGKRKHS